MNKTRIISPMPIGNGAYIAHRHLESRIQGYQVIPYNPKWSFFPIMLPLVASTRSASLLHTTPDYARFFYHRSIPTVITFQNYVLDQWMIKYSSRLQRIHYATDLKWWTLAVLKKCRAVTAVSNATAELIEKDLGLKDQVQVIYNGVDTAHFRPDDKNNFNRKDVRIFFSGNLTLRKGAHWLPEIAKGLKNNATIFYTQGLRTRRNMPTLPNLQSVGPVSFSDMPQRYHDMDILLMPTVREGLSLAVLEAMACGLPVVASDCSSLPEQIDQGKGGFLCPVGDVNAFREKLNLLAESPSLRRKMGEYNRSKVEKMFSIEQTAKKYQTLFEEILTASAKSGKQSRNG